MGSGTTGMVAKHFNRNYIGFDLGYIDMAERRIAKGYKTTKPKNSNILEGQISMFDN
jgi:DNA modification methylase